jgi:hypothetical protein
MRDTPTSGHRETLGSYRESPRGYNRDGPPGSREGPPMRYEESPRTYRAESSQFPRRASGYESHGPAVRGGYSVRGRGGGRGPGWRPREDDRYGDDGYYSRDEGYRGGHYDAYEGYEDEEGAYGDYQGYGEGYVDPNLGYNVILAPIPGAVPLMHAPLLGRGFFPAPGRGRMPLQGRGRMPMHGRGW